MHFSTQVDFSRRYGKTIGKSMNGLNYHIKKELEQLDNQVKRNFFCDNLEDLIKSDLLLCVWLYYSEYDKFLPEFKDYVLTMDDDEFKLIVNSTVHLGNVMDNFWLETNDPQLKSEYVYENALNEYIKRVESNGYKYNSDESKDDSFKILIKNAYYRMKNNELFNKYLKLTFELKNARIDDTIQMRTKDEWEILYSIRYLYKNIINELIDKKNSKNIYDERFSMYRYEPNFEPNNNDIGTLSELYKIKQKYEDLLMFYQDSTEGLEWYNPYSTKIIENLEYFPRETSKPSNEWAYSSYYDLENTAQKVVDNLIETRKRRREEREIEFNKRWKKIEELMEQKNNRIRKIPNFLQNGFYYGTRLSIIIALSAVTYAYLF